MANALKEKVISDCIATFNMTGYTSSYCLEPCRAFIADTTLGMCEYACRSVIEAKPLQYCDNACRAAVANAPFDYCTFDNCVGAERDVHFTEYFLPQSWLEVQRIAVLLLMLFALDLFRQLYRAAGHCKKYACRTPVRLENDHAPSDAPAAVGNPNPHYPDTERKYPDMDCKHDGTTPGQPQNYTLVVSPKIAEPSLVRKLMHQGVFNSLNMTSIRLRVPCKEPNVEWMFKPQVDWHLLVGAIAKLIFFVVLPVSIAVHYCGLFFEEHTVVRVERVSVASKVYDTTVGFVNNVFQAYPVIKAAESTSMWAVLSVCVTAVTTLWALYQGLMATYMRFVMNSIVFQFVNAFVASPISCPSMICGPSQSTLIARRDRQ